MTKVVLPPEYVEIAAQLAGFEREYRARMEGLARLTETMRAPVVPQFAEQIAKIGEDARASITRVSEAFETVARLNADHAKSWASAYQDVAASLALALQVPQLFENFKLPVFKWVDRDERVHKAACKLADAGWAFFWDATAVAVVNLADANLSTAELDDEIVGYYEDEDGADLKVLTERLVTNARLAKWRDWLGDALWAYEQQRYRLAIPSLLSIIEGLVYDTVGTLSDRSTQPATQWRLKAPAGGQAPGFYVEVGWSVVAGVLAALWKRHYFDESTPPDGLNRHWVLHGRRPDVGGKADALRLIVALDCIVITIEHTKERLERQASEDEDPAA
jgi:hypothetical protein